MDSEPGVIPVVRGVAVVFVLVAVEVLFVVVFKAVSERLERLTGVELLGVIILFIERTVPMLSSNKYCVDSVKADILLL